MSMRLGDYMENMDCIDRAIQSTTVDFKYNQRKIGMAELALYAQLPNARNDAFQHFHEVLNRLSAYQRLILTRLSALTVIKFGTLAISEKTTETNPEDYVCSLQMFLCSEKGFTIARMIVDAALPDMFGRDIWLPVIHRVILEARELAENLVFESV